MEGWFLVIGIGEYTRKTTQGTYDCQQLGE